jgi:hypothetical protein
VFEGGKAGGRKWCMTKGRLVGGRGVEGRKGWREELV